MHLVQILLPLYDAAEDRFERSAFDGIAQELSERFGGATLYARAPATGLWMESPGKTARDDIVVCEVMVETLEPEWWGSTGAGWSGRSHRTSWSCGRRKSNGFD